MAEPLERTDKLLIGLGIFALCLVPVLAFAVGAHSSFGNAIATAGGLTTALAIAVRVVGAKRVAARERALRERRVRG